MRIFDNEQIVTQNCVATWGRVTRDLRNGDSQFAFEPKAHFVSENDQRDRHAADVCGGLRQVVKNRLRQSVHDVVAVERGEPKRLIGGG